MNDIRIRNFLDAFMEIVHKTETDTFKDAILKNAKPKIRGEITVKKMKARGIYIITKKQGFTTEKYDTNHVSETQRYKMLGNGWTIDVISHIFSFISL